MTDKTSVLFTYSFNFTTLHLVWTNRKKWVRVNKKTDLGKHVKKIEKFLY